MITRRKSLALIREDLGDCRRCGLHETRKNIVFGRGNPDATVMFVGEGPGADEDQQGLPFVGRAGQLLDKIISAMGFPREDVYIGNIVKCRPTSEDGMNRPPAPAEIEPCYPFLLRQIAAIRPAVVVALGNPATKTLLGTDVGITRLRGRWARIDPERHGETRIDPDRAPPVSREEIPGDLGSIPVMPTFHPAFLLRVPAGKKYVARDMRKVLRYLTKVGLEPPLPSRLKTKALGHH